MEYTEKQAKEQYEVGYTYDTLSTECGVDYTLPDYMPEIRKLLRVDARPIPSGRYFTYLIILEENFSSSRNSCPMVLPSCAASISMRIVSSSFW